MKRKIFSFFLILVVSILPINTFAANPLLKVPLPDFVKQNPYFKKSPLKKFIQFGIFPDNRKVILFSGEKKDKNGNVRPITKISFYNEYNAKEKEVTFHSYAKLKTFYNISNPITAIQLFKIDKGDYIPDNIEIYNSKGIFIKEIPNPEHNYLFSSIDNKYLCLVGLMDGVSRKFKFIALDSLKDKLHEFTVTFKNNPIEHWILCGGDNVSLIYGFGATVSKINIKDQGKIEWKIDNLEHNINLIRLLNKNIIGIEAYPYFFIVNAINGEIIKKINLKKNPHLQRILTSSNFKINIDKNSKLVYKENSPNFIIQGKYEQLKTPGKTFYLTIKDDTVLIY